MSNKVQSQTPVILLSYFFSPCNLTAANRALSWAEQLSQFGYYPIVVTRNWDLTIEKEVDMSRPSGKEVRIEYKGDYEVHYLPFCGSYRDKRYVAKEGQSDRLIKLGTAYELFVQNLSSRAIPFSNMEDYLMQLFALRPELGLMVVSANPYNQFRFAWKLKRRFPRLKWIADYRDDWTTRELNRPEGLVHRVLRKIERKSELRWVRSASRIISVTQTLTDRIVDFVGVEGHTIANGYPAELIEGVLPAQREKGEFIITYSGYLYDEQNIGLFCEAFRKLCASDTLLKPVIQFVGLAYYPPAEERIRELLEGYEDNYVVTGRVSLRECLALELASDALLMVAYGDHKGIPASKLYQYVGCKKPIILCPSDDDIIQSILSQTGLGLVANSASEAFEVLSEMLEKSARGQEFIRPNIEAIKSFSRKNQTECLAHLLDKIQEAN